MKYKLICSDLDDTLLNSAGEIPDDLKGSVDKYVNAGGKFCIVTGRMTVGTAAVVKKLGLTGEIITYQGAVVSEIGSGKILFTQCIEPSDAAEVARYLEQKGIYFQTYEGDYFLTEKGTRYSDIYAHISNAEYRETGIKLSEYITNNGLNPPKILIIAEPKEVPGIMNELKEAFGARFRINTSKPFIIEIIPKNISKAVAVGNLAAKYGIKREEIICVGDSENDLPMIEYAGLGVAVGNASEEVKSRADIIAPSCDEGGLKWTIEKFGLM